MDNEVPLPPPPRIRHRSPTLSSSRRSFQKPRHLSRVDDLSSQPASSDAALFSSDDIPESGLENYHAAVPGEGRKRRYRGTWWGETVPNSKKKRVDFKDKRFVDSGIWMASDESGAESLLPSDDTSAWGADLMKNTREYNTFGKGPDPLRQQYQTVSQPRNVFRKVEEPTEHQLARAVVNDCLEKGQDKVDLRFVRFVARVFLQLLTPSSDCNLRTIPSDLLRPLQQLTKLPPVEPPITEDVYSSLQPFLCLFLARNSLTALSSELFELSSLNVLSVRNNKLTEIPPAIRRLTSLQTVNFSVNRLQYLPWDLLWLIQNGDLKHMTVRPNPLLQITDSEIAQWHYPKQNQTSESPLQMYNYTGSIPAEAWDPIHIATGPIQRFDMEGQPVSGYKNGITTNDMASRAPSLREVALLAILKSPLFDQLTEPEELGYYPQLVARLLQQARE
ncbi:leucine Rich Repeat Protein, partial [Aspergillus sclerotialis]